MASFKLYPLHTSYTSANREGERGSEWFTDKQNDRQGECISAFSACCHHHYSETDQTCLSCSAALKGAVTDMLLQLSHPPSSHPQKAPTGCILILCCAFYPRPPTSTLPFPFCWRRPPPSSACFLLWNGAFLNHTALLACSLFHSSFFCSLSFSLAGSLSKRLSCWSTVRREPQATKKNNN